MIKIFTKTCIAVTAFLALGQPATAQTNAQWEKVIEAARHESALVLYATPSFDREVGRSFQEKYGIHIDVLVARASELRERIRAEQVAKRFSGDVQLNGENITGYMVEDGNFEPHGWLPNSERLVPSLKTDKYRIPVFVQNLGILINTALVRSGDEPKSWNDLLDPKWRGKILSDDLRVLGSGSVLFNVLYDAFGRGYMEKLATQNLVFSRNVVNDGLRVARGEYAMYITQNFPYYLQMQGLPVKFIVPKEGRPYVAFELAILKNAPHPNAARLFVNYFLDRETQLRYANAGYNPAVNGVAGSARKEVREILSTKALGTSVPEERDKMVDLSNKLFK
jgi:iron(III) transport system substrate-binding protein